MQRKKVSKEFYKTLKKGCIADGEWRYILMCFGDEIAKRQEYLKHKGLDALHFYLVEKYHWLPCHVKSLSDNDLKFLFVEEMQGWHLSEDAGV